MCTQAPKKDDEINTKPVKGKKKCLPFSEKELLKGLDVLTHTRSDSFGSVA
ncbi:hypothetical protein L4D76_01680 [Photobacterium sagamiensis]|uniref:hypothetical protein n=1 Tax=Photobacterium sagamiensis TaxID=2910241 RepID=UPI003D0DAA08